VGDVILAGIRRIDTGARFDGDEFLVLLPETDSTGGWVLAEKIRQGVAEGELTAEGVALSTSVVHRHRGVPVRWRDRGRVPGACGRGHVRPSARAASAAPGSR
jgi:GGDEF domain-containing protein